MFLICLKSQRSLGFLSAERPESWLRKGSNDKGAGDDAN